MARRLVAVLATTGLLSGGLATGMLSSPAYAFPGAITISSFTPDQWDNRSQVTMTLTGTGFFNNDQTGLTNDLVYLSPDPATLLDTSREVTDFYVTAETNPNVTTQLTAKFNLAQVPPGKYRVYVKDFNGSHTSSPAPALFTVYAFGGANASSSKFGTNDANSSPACTGNNCVSRGAGPLDITGSNIAVGAKVRFLHTDNTVDNALSFTVGNPNHDTNNLGEDANGTAGDDGTGYVSTTLLQGNYALDDTVAGFTPGLHKLQIINTDGNTTGATSTFSQPWFPNNQNVVTPTGVGIGSSNVVVTLTAQGIVSGSSLFIERHATTNPACADITIGQSTVSDLQPDGTFHKISAPVSMADCNTDNTVTRAIGISGPDGASFSRGALLHIVANPVFADDVLTSGYETLGQGAHVGFGSEEVDIFGTGFQGDPAFAGVPGGNPDKMTKFDFGDGITATTVLVGSGFAQVRIDVASDAPVGDRTVTAINPDGGRATRAGAFLPGGLPDPTGPAVPLTIEAGPQVTKVSPAGLPASTTSGAVTITVTGTFTTADTFTAKVCQHLETLDCTETPNVNEGGVTDTATTLTFQISTNNAPGGPKDLVITDTTNKGRFYCSGCMGIDSLTLMAPTSVPNTGPTTLSFSDAVGIDQVTAASTATLTRQIPLTGQNPIGLKAGTTLTPGSGGSNTASGQFDVTDAAPGTYSITVTKDPGSANPTTWTCTGCLTITGAAITTTAVTREPGAKAATGGQGATGLLLKIVGTNFVHGIQVTIPDVTVHDLTIVSPTELSLKVDVPNDATTGGKVITVTSGDGVGPNTGSKTTNLSFTVTAKPAPTGAPTPASYGQGAGTAGYLAANTGQTVPISVSGTAGSFQSDAQLSLGPDVDVTDEAVAPGTPPSCPVPLDPCPVPLDPGTPDVLTGKVVVAEIAAAGKRDVVVTNGDGGVGSIAEAFTVTDGPKVSSVSGPNQAPLLVPDGQPHAITVSGSNFATSPAATLAVVPATDVTIANVVVTASKITADITVATTATLGTRTVGVTNSSDKGYGSLTPVYVAKTPSAPTNLVLTPLGQSLKATWAVPASNGGAPITGYHLTLQKTGSATKTLADVNGSTLTYTFAGLVNGSSYTIAVNAVNVAGAGTSATKTGVAGIVTTLTNAASTKLVTAGSAVRFSGKLVAGSAGVSSRVISLLFTRSVGSSFTRVVRTNVSGNWSYVYVPSYTFSVKASFAGDSTYRPASTSAIPVTVRSLVKVTSPGSASTSNALVTLKISGYVSPNHARTSVYLYRFIGSTRYYVARATLSTSSTFTFSLRPSKGTYVYKVYIAATTGNAANYSPSFTVKRV